MTINFADPKTRRDIAIATSAVALTVILMVVFFDRWPIENTSLALDWRGLWNGIKDGHITFDTGWRFPPWSAVFALPLGFLSFRSSWGMVALLTIAVQILAVSYSQKRWHYWLSVGLAVVSFTTLRVIADGNLEFMVLGGALLILYAFRTERPVWLAIGFLLLTTKVQLAWVLVIVMAVYLLKWPMRQKLLFAGTLAIFVVPTMLIFGQAWLNSVIGIPEAGSIMNSGLNVALSWHGVDPVIRTILWLICFGLSLYIGLANKRTLSREKISMLIAAGLLLSPYSAPNSFYALLALSVIPLLQNQPRIGIPLLVLTNLSFILPTDFRYDWGAVYFTGIFALVWAASVWQVYQAEMRRADALVAVSTAPIT